MALQDVAVPAYSSSKETSKIKIYHTDDTHHKEHVINRAISALNQFVAASFRNKDSVVDIRFLNRLGKVFGMQFAAGKNAPVFKSKEYSGPVKERLARCFSALINQENDFVPPAMPIKPAAQYKFYICTGNNGVMVRSILKQRWWWTYGNKNDESLNLFWTQWSKKSFIQSLPSKRGGKQIQDTASKERLDSSAATQSNVSVESEGDAATTTSRQTGTPKAKMTGSLVPAVGSVRMCNHLENHYHLSNKKAMFFNMNQYYLAMKRDPFDTLPLTFHIRTGVDDPEFQKFALYYQALEANIKASAAEKAGKGSEDSKPKDPSEQSGVFKPIVEKNIWIIKPGENSNRGNGIQVLREFEDIKRLVSAATSTTHAGETSQRTYIVQKYIERPLLINKRKFDIRMYGMMTSIGGTVKGYFYEEGYLRTSCKEYTLKNLSKKTIHLTNDAVQVKAEDYGRYETGNKLSFSDFQKYLDANYGPLHIDFCRDILTQIKVSPGATVSR